MKRQFISWGLMLAATFTLTNCAQEIENPAQDAPSAGFTFEITANTADTKTVNDGMDTKWVDKDQINLFHAVTDGTNYKSDGAFTVADTEEGRFTGELCEALDPQEEYDWYALYPYSQNIATPGKRTTGYTYIGYSSGLNQTGYNSMASLKGSVCPLYGVKKACPAGTTPSLMMNHLAAIVAINVTNKTEEPLTVTTASLTAQEDIVGSYYIDITADPVDYVKSSDSYVKNTATVNVTSGATELAKGESAVLYLAIKPFTAAEGTTLTLSVNGYAKELKMPKDVTFSAGKIKTLNFSYDRSLADVEKLSLPWIEDFSSKDLSKYVISNGTGNSTTALYTTGDMLAGGAAPEILIAKNNGSLTATIATGGFSGELTLVFKSNHADYIKVTATSVTLNKVTDSEYTITVPEGVSTFDMTLTNTATSNARVDDIELAKSRLAQTLTFETELFKFAIDSDELDSFTGQEVSGNQTEVTYSSNNVEIAVVDEKTGAVTLTGKTGLAVITATAAQTEEYKSAVVTYTIDVFDPSAVVVEKTVTYDFGKDAEVEFSKWSSSYASHTASYEDATITFTSANKQSGTITDCPVTKGQPLAIVMGDNRTLKSFKLNLKQWSTKTQTVTLSYSKDGGATYTPTTTTSSNFELAADLPEGTNAIKFTFSSTSNQVGIASCELTFDVAN